MAIYRCSSNTCPVRNRNLDAAVKVCAKCGSKVKLVKNNAQGEVDA